MKKKSNLIFIYIFLLFLSIICFSKTTSIAYAEEKKEQVSNDLEESINDLIKETDLSGYEEFLKELQILNESYTIESLINGVINDKFEFDFKFFISYMIKIFLGDIKGLIIQVIIILITVVLMSILQNSTSAFSNSSVKKIVYLACYGTIIAVITAMIGVSINSVNEYIIHISKFTNAVFPILLTLVTTIGATATVAVYQPIIIIFSQLLVKIINFVVMPTFYICFVFSIIGNLSDDLKINKISKFAKSVGEWVLGIVFGLFITYTTSRGITGASIDSLASKGAKYALQSYVPVIGNYLKDGFDLITASCIVIKNSLGFVSIFIFLLFSIIPLLKIICTMLIIKLSAGLVEPFSDKKISDMLYSVSKSLSIPLTACICMIFSVLIIIMLIILTCNRGVI